MAHVHTEKSRFNVMATSTLSLLPQAGYIDIFLKMEGPVASKKTELPKVVSVDQVTS